MLMDTRMYKVIVKHLRCLKCYKRLIINFYKIKVFYVRVTVNRKGFIYDKTN